MYSSFETLQVVLYMSWPGFYDNILSDHTKMKMWPPYLPVPKPFVILICYRLSFLSMVFQILVFPVRPPITRYSVTVLENSALHQSWNVLYSVFCICHFFCVYFFPWLSNICLLEYCLPFKSYLKIYFCHTLQFWVLTFPCFQ